MKNILFILFCWVVVGANAQNRIAGYEYWFNQGFEARVRATVAHTLQAAISLDAPTTGLPSGIHLVHIRGFDTGGLFSPALSQFFYKAPPLVAGGANQMAGYEYWFNNEFSTRTRSAVAPGTQAAISLDAPTTGLPSGIHLVHIRGFDTRGLFSPTLSQFFYKAPPAQVGQNRQIIAYQYWLGNDYSKAVTVNVSPRQQLLLVDAITTQGIATGLHLFNIRFLDNTGLWSATTSQFFFKHQVQEVTGNNLITGYRYWLNNNPATAVNVELQNPVQDLLLIDGLDMTRIPKGTYSIHFRFRDSRGMWSLVTHDVFIKNALPLADFRYEITQHCDSTVVSFHDMSVDAVNYHWNFGDGTTSSLRNPSRAFTAPGTYRVELTVSDPVAGLDSTLVKNVVVPVGLPNVGVSVEGNVLTATATGALYRWLDCNDNFRPVTGAIGQVFTAAISGSYAVEVNQNGCIAISGCHNVIVVGIEERRLANSAKLYPNPTGGRLYIDLGAHRERVAITILDQAGRTVLAKEPGAGQVFPIDLSLAPGVYITRVVAGQEVVVLRFVMK